MLVREWERLGAAHTSFIRTQAEDRAACERKR